MAIAGGPFTRERPACTRLEHWLRGPTRRDSSPLHGPDEAPGIATADSSPRSHRCASCARPKNHFRNRGFGRALLTERQILLDWARLGEAANGFLEAPNDTLKASRREEHV